MIDVYARNKLKKVLDRHGLVETLVWNRRTGNLVGGHQRISVLDELEGTSDYSLTVSVIDVDEGQEREINIALNNPSIGGGFDQELLERMIKESPKPVDREATGFDGVEWRAIFGEEAWGTGTGTKHEKEMVNKLAGTYRKQKSREATDNDANHYLVVTFLTTSELDEFRDYFGLPKGEVFIDGPGLFEILKRRLIAAAT